MSSALPQGSHITRKRGIYYWRRRLPGRRRGEVALSLRTRRYREAEHRAALLDGRFNLVWREAPARMMEDKDGTKFAAILRDYLREVLAADLAPVAPPHGPVPRGFWPAEWLEDALANTLDALADRDPRPVAHDVDRLMRRHGLGEDVRDGLGIGVLEAQVRVYQELLRRARGEVPMVAPAEVCADQAIPQRPEPEPGPPPQPKQQPESTKPSASALAEGFFARRASRDRMTHQVMAQERGTLRRFVEVCGDRPIDRYGRGDVTRFLDTMRRLPKTYGKSPKDKDRPLSALIAEADAAGAPRLTDKTVKRHLSALSQFFHFVMDFGHITNAQRGELVDGHRFREERKARHQRDAWTPEELRTLFRSPVWTGCHRYYRTQPGDQIIRDAKFWLPILALYHGARLEELADLYRRDVWCDGGTWAIRITETEGDGGGRRRLKTEAAARVIPLHPELIRLGFLAYVAETAPNPDDPLFPDLKPQGKDGKRGPRITRWFVEYRKAIGIYREGVGMHAFRHTAITRLTNALTNAQQVRHRDFLMGHSSGGSEGSVRYDKGPGLKEVAGTLALLRYPEVDLSHLHVPGGPSI